MNKKYTVLSLDGGTIKFETSEEFQEYVEDNYGDKIISAAEKIYIVLNTLGNIGPNCVYEEKGSIIESIWELIEHLAENSKEESPCEFVESGKIRVTWDDCFELGIYFNLSI